jgi:hypothetical protein
MHVQLENLELIPTLMDKIENLTIQISQLANVKNKVDLTKLLNVSKYLNVSKSTIFNYMKDGRFQENIHYRKILNKKVVKYIFVESSIIKFKESQ